mmetsp:Transcript_61705/g.133691  ORF Transcript_61705/g.133691 Transcript_61705/m.133691 type:complete len:421 (+) Transcript_61705:272-1534(+)
MFQLTDPEDTPHVGLLCLCERDEVAVDQPAHSEVYEAERRNRRRERAENDTDAHVDGEACASGAEAVVVLVLRLGLGRCRIVIIEVSEGQELGEIDIPQEVHAVRDPLKDEEVHIEVRRLRHFLGEQQGETHWICEEHLSEGQDVVSDRCHHDDENDLEDKVPPLEFCLCPAVRPQSEESSEDEDQKSRQKGDHELQAQSRSQASPDRLQRAHVDGASNRRHPDDTGQIDDVKNRHKYVSDGFRQGLASRTLLQVTPEQVRGLRRGHHHPFVHVDAVVQRQGHFSITPVVKGHEACPQVHPTEICGLFLDPGNLLLGLLASILDLFRVEIDEITMKAARRPLLGILVGGVPLTLDLHQGVFGRLRALKERTKSVGVLGDHRGLDLAASEHLPEEGLEFRVGPVGLWNALHEHRVRPHFWQ